MIIAVDFDGILATDDGRFPKIGSPVWSMVSFVKKLVEDGHEVVLWTSRADKALEDAVKWCEDFGLHFCAVNDNAPSNKAEYVAQYPNGTRKVHADVYVDDHDPAFIADKITYGPYAAIQNTISRVRRIINEYR